MNCDDAFEYITDPNRQHASELLWHLDMCPRCQRMKETLEPALSLLTADNGVATSEASRSGTSRISGRFTGATATLESRHIAETAAISPRDNRQIAARSTEAGFRRGLVVAFAGAALFAGMLLMFLPGGKRDAGIAPDVEMCLWQTREAPVENSPRAVLATCLSCHPTSP